MHLYDLPACLALCVLLCMSLKKGTRFGAMVVHSGTSFGGVHYFAVSQTFMSTSMARDYRVRSPSPPPSPSQPGRSLPASPEAKRRDPPPSRGSNARSTSMSQPREAGWPARSLSASTAVQVAIRGRGGHGAGGGGGGETSGCATLWGVVCSTEARILPMVAKIPNFPL